MLNASRLVIALFIFLSLSCRIAYAEEISVAGAEFGQLPQDSQKKLVAAMKDKGVLAKDDSVKYVGPVAADDKKSLGPAILITLVPTACKIIAAAKKQEDLGKCGEKKEAEAQERCKLEVETKFSTVETICGAIKLM